MPDHRQVLILGSGPRAQGIAVALHGHARIVGHLDDSPVHAEVSNGCNGHLGPLSALRSVVREHAVSEVIFALPRSAIGSDRMANLFATCELLGVDFTLPLDFYDLRAAQAIPASLPGQAAVTFSSRPHHARWKLATKRVLDVLGAAALILLTAPVWLTAVIAVRLEGAGPIIFVQERVGRHGKRFPMYKLRTMVVDAEERLAALGEQNQLAGPVFKLTDDPRITRVGAVLRRYSIDELPQLLNILKGDMSLVGPRPPIPAEVQRYEADHWARLTMRPGLTCLWQISGRNQIPFEDWVKLDREYVDRWGLLLDLRILAATIPAVLRARGAS